MLVNPATFLQKAHRHNYAIGAFNVNNLETLQGVIEGAIESKAPIIIQTSQGAIKYAGLETIGAMVATLANQTKTPIALHLDHGTDMNLIKKVIKSGLYTSVMIDMSAKPFEENVKLTHEIVTLAHKNNIYVEAELGAIPGQEDEINIKENQSFLTDALEAAAFAELTGCDSLAISIGTKHGVFKYSNDKVKLDIKTLEEIKKLTNIPLVLHGASEIPKSLKKIAEQYGADLKDAHGVSKSVLKNAIKHGINKVNTDSDLRIAFTGAIDKYMTKNPNNMDPRKYLNAGREAVKKATIRRIKQLGSFNKA